MFPDADDTDALSVRLAVMYCNIDLQSVVPERRRPLVDSSGGNNPQDTTGYNPMLQDSVGSGRATEMNQLKPFRG